MKFIVKRFNYRKQAVVLKEVEADSWEDILQGTRQFHPLDELIEIKRVA